jgi:hypothetical protein
MKNVIVVWGFTSIVSFAIGVFLPGSRAYSLPDSQCLSCRKYSHQSFVSVTIVETMSDTIRCVEWDNIPPAHCASVPTKKCTFTYIDAEGEQYTGTGYKTDCKSGTPSATTCQFVVEEF